MNVVCLGVAVSCVLLQARRSDNRTDAGQGSPALGPGQPGFVNPFPAKETWCVLFSTCYLADCIYTTVV